MEKEIVCSLEKEGFRGHFYLDVRKQIKQLFLLVEHPVTKKQVLQKNYCHRVESHIYEKGSHALIDGINEMSGFTKFLFKLMIPAEKKYPRECEEARQDSFKRIIKFIEEW